MAAEQKSVSNSITVQYSMDPFATQTWKITEIIKKKQKDLQLIYGCGIACNCSIAMTIPQ